MQTFHNITRHGYRGIEVDGSLLFSSPRSKRLVAFTARENLALTRERLDDSLAKTGLSVVSRQSEKPKIGFINTNYCLLRCVYCFNNAGASQDYLQPDLAESVIKALLEEGKREQLGPVDTNSIDPSCQIPASTVFRPACAAVGAIT